MNTLTIFDAYVKTEESISQIERDIANAKLSALVGLAQQMRRRLRQQDTFAAAMRARLAQCALIVQLADMQSLLINEKNDEIASLTQHIADLETALRHAQAHSYADDLLAVGEAGMMEMRP